jgi:hypothetical protein
LPKIKRVFILKKVKPLIFLFTVIITTITCSCSKENIYTLTTGSFITAESANQGISLTDNELKNFEKEYSAFNTKALTQSYFERKVIYWLDSGEELRLLKELLFAQFKHPSLAYTFFIANTNIQQEIQLKPLVSARMGIDPAFADFMSYSLTDSDAQVFISAAGITDTIQHNAINTLVTDLKGYGIWNKMKAIYPMVGGTASSHKWNLKDPRDLDSAFRLSFNGGWVHSETGAKPNGTDASANTFFTPSINFSSNTNLSFSTYLRTNDISHEMVDMGSVFNIILEPYYVNAGTYFMAGSGTYTHYDDAIPTGFYLASRINNIEEKTYKNGVLKATGTFSSQVLDGAPIYLGAFGTHGYYSARECAFSHIGDGLTDTEADNLNTAVQTFETALERQIN